VSDEGRKALRLLKKRPEEYSMRILELKAKHLGEGADQRDLTTMLVQKLVVEMRLREIHGFEMMDEESYLAYQKYRRNCDDQEAARRWQVVIADKDVFSVNVDGVLWVAVPLNTTYQREKTICKTSELQQAAVALKTDAEKQKGLKRAKDVLQLDPSSGLFDTVGGKVHCSGRSGGLLEWEQNKQLREKEAIDQQLLGKAKTDQLIALSSPTLTPGQKALRRTEMSLRKQSVSLELEKDEAQLLEIRKQVIHKFNDKALTNLTQDHREALNPKCLTDSIDETVLNSRNLRDRLRLLRPEEDDFEDSLNSMIREQVLIENHIEQSKMNQGQMLSQLQTMRDEEKKRKREETKDKTSRVLSSGKDFTPLLPPSVQTVVLRTLSGSERDKTLVFNDDYTGIEFLTPTLFGRTSPMAVAIMNLFDVWGTKALDAYLKTAAAAMTASSPSACLRLPAPKETCEKAQVLDSADWFKPMSEKLGIGMPRCGSSYGLPWVILVKPASYIGGMASLPMTTFGGHLVSLAPGGGTCVIVTPLRIVKATSPISFFHSNGGRAVQAHFRHDKLWSRLIEEHETLWVPSGCTVSIFTSPARDDSSQSGSYCSFVFVPHLSKAAAEEGQAIDNLLEDGIKSFEEAFSSARKQKNLNWSKLGGFAKWYKELVNGLASVV